MIQKSQFLFNEDDVIQVNKDYLAWYEHPMFKVSQFMAKIKLILKNNMSYSSEKKEKLWLEDGIDCELLKIGAKSWQKGKIKLTFKLEFIPEEPEIEEIYTEDTVETDLVKSSLDELRQVLTKDNY